MGDADQKALNALAKGAGVTAIGMMVSKALTYFYRISIARFLGPDAYGQLSLALMVTGIASTIAYLAMGQGLKKFIPEYRTREDFASIKGAVLSALHITIPISVILWAITFFGAEFISKTFFDNTSMIPLVKIISFTIITGVLTRTFFDTTLGFNKIIYKTGTIKVLQNIIQLGVTIALLILGYNVASAAWGWLAGSLISMILGFYFLEKKIGPIITSKIEPNYNRKELIRFSSPLLLSGLIGTLMGYADTGLLGYYMTDFEVGLYNAALPTAMLILLPHKAIGSLALTSFSELKERDPSKIQESMQTATAWVFSLVLPAFLLLVFFSDIALNLLWGSQYAEAYLVLSVLAIGYVVDAIVGRVGSLLQSKGHTKYLLYNNSLALVLNLFLNILFIPNFGILGAAVSTAVSHGLTNILMFAEVWRKENIISTPFEKIGRIVLSGTLPLLILIAFDLMLFENTPFWFLIPAGTIYGLLYVVLYTKIVGIGEEEKKVFIRLGELIGYKEKINKMLNYIT